MHANLVNSIELSQACPSLSFRYPRTKSVEGVGKTSQPLLSPFWPPNCAPITDTAGNPEEYLDYYPYGSVRIDEASTTFSAGRKFLGQYYDAPTELSYLNARYYDGGRGQFLSEDLVFLGDPKQQDLTNPQSLNSYSYGNDNPITNSDPNGKSAAGVPLNPYEAALLILFAPAHTSYDPVYESAQYQAEQDPKNQIANMVMGLANPIGAESKAGEGILEGAIPWLQRGEKNTDVYVGMKDGSDAYVGISKDVDQRAAQHGDRFDSLQKVTPTQYTRNQARAMEQEIMNNNSNYENKINSISPLRAEYSEALNWAKSELQNIYSKLQSKDDHGK